MVCRGRLCGGEEGKSGGEVAGCGVVISSVQMRTCLCLRDAALSQAKDSIHVVRGIMGTPFPLSAFWESRGYALGRPVCWPFFRCVIRILNGPPQGHAWLVLI